MIRWFDRLGTILSTAFVRGMLVLVGGIDDFEDDASQKVLRGFWPLFCQPRRPLRESSFAIAEHVCAPWVMEGHLLH